jgi:hypothetical protein
VLDLAMDFGAQIAVIALLAALALLGAWLVRSAEPGPFGVNWSAAFLTAGSAAAVLVATLTRRGDAQSPGEVQLVPLRTLRLYLHASEFHPGWARDVLVYAGGNVLMMVPFAFFLYLALRRGVILTSLAAMALSISVEILQLPIWSRSSDIDDVILNTAGGVLGAVLAAAFCRLRQGSEPASGVRTRGGAAASGRVASPSRP